MVAGKFAGEIGRHPDPYTSEYLISALMTRSGETLVNFSTAPLNGTLASACWTFERFSGFTIRSPRAASYSSSTLWCGIYLPNCDVFVTADVRQWRALRVLNVFNRHRKTRILTYRQLIERLGLLGSVSSEKSQPAGRRQAGKNGS